MATVQIYKDGNFDVLIEQFQTKIADDMSEEELAPGEFWYDRLIDLISSKHKDNWTKIVWLSIYLDRYRIFDTEILNGIPVTNSNPTIVPRIYLFGNKNIDALGEINPGVITEQYDLSTSFNYRIDTIKSPKLHITYLDKILGKKYDEIYKYVTVAYNANPQDLLILNLNDYYMRAIAVNNFADILKILDNTII